MRSRYKTRAEMTPEQRAADNRKTKRARKRRLERARLLEQGINVGDPEIVRKATSKYLASLLRQERQRSWLLAERLQEKHR